MTKFRALAVFVLIGVAVTSPSFGQSAGDAATSQTPGTATIFQNFLTIESAALQRELRVVYRCINQAQQNLRDIQGNINMVAQTDLLNCRRRLQQLLRDEANLRRISARRAAEAEAAAQLLGVSRQRSGSASSSQ